MYVYFYIEWYNGFLSASITGRILFFWSNMNTDSAWRGLLKRVLHRHENQVTAEVIPEDDGCDTYEIDGVAGRIILRGNSVNSLAAALGDYLRYDADVNLSWCGSRMDLPELLPAPTPRRRVIRQKYRSYLNYCTFNYSASWWDWERWEKELDFMALNGINFPLATVGVECIWYETLRELGFSENEALAFFSGPSFLAWQWMTNIEGFAGPLPSGWIEKRKTLGKQIINRQLELGMTPIQQGFSGFVPRLLKTKLPTAKIQIKTDWCGIAGTAQLDPTDSAFAKIGHIFLTKQKELFGTYGYYASDPFHEGKPPVESAEYLQKVGEAIDALIRNFDPDGIWVMQSWSIRKEIACAVSKKHLLILDLAGAGHKKHEGFWGYPFITGNLHNFGGRTALHGDLNQLSENSFIKIRSKYPNVCGTGLFMEGINQNPVYYDLAFEMMTRSDGAELDDWLKCYIKRRYGKCDMELKKAWELLSRTVYAPGTNGVEKSSIICARPAVNVKKSGPNDGFHIPYGNRRLLKALEHMLQSPCSSDGYRYDVVDVLRQILSNYGQKLYAEVSEAFKNREAARFKTLNRSFLELLEDMDMLLSLRSEFSLTGWIKDARRWGESPEEADYMEYCACLLLTLWGNEENPRIFDYAWREWSGLIRNYYKRRWEIFFNYLEQCMDKGLEYEEDTLPQVCGRETFRANGCYEIMADFETEWLHTKKDYTSCALDFEDTINSLLKKYSSRI
ncbi:MAG: alpha-N-acetylglucosaminidase [Eubacteriales bacterium]